MRPLSLITALTGHPCPVLPLYKLHCTVYNIISSPFFRERAKYGIN